MANIQITGLTPADNAESQDLVLIRKSGQGADNSITISKLVTSIGNSAVSGYYQYSYDENDKSIWVKPSNNALVPDVTEGMRITFIALDDIDGQALITLNGNDKYPLYQYNKNFDEIRADVENADYIEAIFKDGVFFQTNIPTEQVYTNEYNVESTNILEDESATTYSLESAIGIKATSYYKGMSIIFTVDTASKGGVSVNVDDIGPVFLTDKAGDKIANPLVEDQLVLAIFDGDKFIKSYFSESVEDAPELPEEAFNDEGEIDIDAVPEENIHIAHVGSSSDQYPTIKAAIDDLVNNFGEDGGNRLCTIKLSSGFQWTEKISLVRKNYAWITITSETPIFVPPNKGELNLTSSSINISGNYNIRKNNGYFIKCKSGSDIRIKNLTCTIENALLQVIASKFSITDSVIIPYSTTISPSEFISTLSANNSVISNVTLNNPADILSGFSRETVLRFEKSDILINELNSRISNRTRYFIISSYSNLSIKNCSFEFVSTLVDPEFNSCIEIKSGTLLLEDSYISCNRKGIFINTRAQAQLNNNDISTKNSENAVFCGTGSEISVLGGTYVHEDQSNPNAFNIVASSAGTIARISTETTAKTNAIKGAIITTYEPIDN